MLYELIEEMCLNEMMSLRKFILGLANFNIFSTKLPFFIPVEISSLYFLKPTSPVKG